MTNEKPKHSSGLDLSRRLYAHAVAPTIESAFLDLPYTAALVGRGSEVLGFDDPMSRDHDWGARVQIFLTQEDHDRHAEHLRAAVAANVPIVFENQPTDVTIHVMRDYLSRLVGADIDSTITSRDWLTISEHRLGMLTAGAVYHDELGFQRVRQEFGYYPRDVWLYLMLSAWWRIHPEANLVGRTGYSGDELGSTLIATRLVHEIMRLCFLIERRYAPYAKWFARAFSELSCAEELVPTLWSVLHARAWSGREEALMQAYETLASMHEALGITDRVEVGPQRLWDRPFVVVWGDFPGALSAQIEDPQVREIADRWPTGGIDEARELPLGRGSHEVLLRLTA